MMQGTILPEISIDFGGIGTIKCTAQVVYRTHHPGGGIRCGISIIDMNINSYTQLANVVAGAMNQHFHISTDVDMEALWEFFFDSGLIYPTKYAIMQENREGIKDTYQKLYKTNPEIARHFTYRRNGRIYGHIFLVRAYENAWLIQHHSATSFESRRIGLLVLRQIMHYLNEMCRLPSLGMDYAMTYFRPNNRVPQRIFGDFVKEVGDPKRSSIDAFGYVLFEKSAYRFARHPEGWTLIGCSGTDLKVLNVFYEERSGGLLLAAMSCTGNQTPNDEDCQSCIAHLA